MLYDIMVSTTTLMFIYSAYDYVRAAWKRKSSPTVATWILMNVVMGLSMVMYLSTPGASITANIGLTAALVNVVIILTGVLWVAIRDDTLRVSFEPVQKACLALAGVLVVFWIWTDHPMISYTLVQGIALIAYIATMVRQWGKAPTKPEPYLLWCAVLAANICAIYPAVVHEDKFAAVYLLRAVPSTAFMIYVIWRKRRLLARALT